MTFGVTMFKKFGLSLLAVIVIVVLWGNSKYNIVAFNICGNSTAGEDFRVLTWNICGADIESREKEENIARLVIEQNADFVQLNEFCLDSCMVIDSLLSEYYPYKNGANAHLHAGDIFYSKRNLFESGRFCEDFPYIVFSKLCFNKDSLYIIGCHLAGNNYEGQIEIDDVDSLHKVKRFWGYYRNAQEKRKEKAHFLKMKVLESSLPMIVMGDMNDFNHSSPMDSLKDAGMKNAWWEGGLGYGATYHEGWLRLRIDHIYYNEKLELKGVKVVETDLSDHNPLIADFSIKE